MTKNRLLSLLSPILLTACATGVDRADAALTIIVPDETLAANQDQRRCFAAPLPQGFAVGSVSWDGATRVASIEASSLLLSGFIDCPNDDATRFFAGGTGPTWTLSLEPQQGFDTTDMQSIVVRIGDVAPRTIGGRAVLHLVPAEQVTAWISAVGFIVDPTTIHVPARGTQTVQGRCAWPSDEPVVALTTLAYDGLRQFDVDIDQRLVLHATSWQSAPHVAVTGVPSDISWRCDFANDTETPVVGGFGPNDQACAVLAWRATATPQNRPWRGSDFCVSQ